MILGKVSQPRSKRELVNRLNELGNIDFKMFEDVDRKELSKVVSDIGRFIQNKEVTVIVVKSKL